MAPAPTTVVLRQPHLDLWSEAADTLSDEQKKIIKSLDLSEGNIANSVLAAAKEQQDKCKEKEWSFSFKGKQVKVRQVLQNILEWTQKFQKVIDFAVSMDVSGHAALPWACVKFFLEVGINNN